MKILVAGGAGYIGSVLVPKLLDAKHEVVVLDRCFFGMRSIQQLVTTAGGVTIVRKDTREVTAADFYGIDRVIDLAGLSNDPACDLDPAFTLAVNFEGGLHLARTAFAAGVPEYLYASSCAVYGAHHPHVRPDELSELNPLSEYARSKIAVERALLRLWNGAEGHLRIFRLATVYGLSPRMRFDLAPNIMALRAHRGQPIELWSPPETWRPFIHVSDVARLLAGPILGDEARLIINAGTDEGLMTIGTLAERIASFKAATIVQKPAGPDARSYRPSFRRLLGLKKVFIGQSLEAGITEILEALDNWGLTDDDSTYTVRRYKALLEAGALCQGGIL